jgi:polyisoprenoid-binding protein YceI
LCACASRAQQIGVRLDPANTTINFTLGATMHTVHGTFKLKSGEIHVDPATGNASGSIVVDATSGDSGDSSRDHNMHANVLESAKFPEIVFSPTLVTAPSGHTLKEILGAAGAGQVEAAGTFRLHGQDHPMTMVLAVESSGNGRAMISAKFPIPYVKWGLKSPNTFFLRVSDTVGLEIRSTAQVAMAQ